MPELEPLEGIDTRVVTWLEQDAERATTEIDDLESVWASLDHQLTTTGWREPFVSASAGVRAVAALFGLAIVGAAMVGIQGVRSDLDDAGWIAFALLGATLMGIGVATTLWSLRSRALAPAPLWPWIPVTWVLLLGFSTVAPWPGVTGIPAAMHAWCFGVTSVGALGATAWLALWEQSVTPVPQRVGLLATGAGISAFVFQGLFCPGVDVAHLVLGHAGPTIGLASVTIGLALLLRR